MTITAIKVIDKKAISNLHALYNKCVVSNDDKSWDNLLKVCKKHEVKLSDYIKDCGGTFYDIDYSKKEVKEPSRRGIILSMLRANKYTKEQILKAIAEQTTRVNKSTDKTALSGTMYDIARIKKEHFKENDKGIFVSVEA